MKLHPVRLALLSLPLALGLAAKLSFGIAMVGWFLIVRFF